MNKLLSVSVLSIVLFGSVDAKIKPYKNIPACNPNDTAIVFDFHGVLAKVHAGKAIKGISKNPKKIKFLKKLSRWKKGRSVETAFLDKHGNVSEADIRTLNPFKIDEEVVKIVRNLKVKGYTVFLCSDIGEKMFNYFRQKHPELFGPNGLFSDCWVSTEENGYLDKKDPRAFESCKKMIQNWSSKNGKKFTKLVMIDDTKGKLKAASKVGFNGFKFKKAKQLHCALAQAMHL